MRKKRPIWSTKTTDFVAQNNLMKTNVNQSNYQCPATTPNRGFFKTLYNKLLKLFRSERKMTSFYQILKIHELKATKMIKTFCALAFRRIWDFFCGTYFNEEPFFVRRSPSFHLCKFFDQSFCTPKEAI